MHLYWLTAFTEKMTETLEQRQTEEMNYINKTKIFYFQSEKITKTKCYRQVKSVQSTLSHLISTSVPCATFTRFLVEHRLFQYYS